MRRAGLKLGFRGIRITIMLAGNPLPHRLIT
jgi:hypothetical protein